MQKSYLVALVGICFFGNFLFGMRRNHEYVNRNPYVCRPTAIWGKQYTTEQAYKAMLSARDDREFLSDHEIAGIKLRIAQERALGNYESALLLHDAYGFHLQYEIKVLERYEEQDYVRDLKIICEK
jgi:hypothetical protein